MSSDMREISSPQAEWTLIGIDQQDSLVWDLGFGPDWTTIRLITVNREEFMFLQEIEIPPSWHIVSVIPIYACSNGLGKAPDVWPPLRPDDELEFIESEQGGLQAWIRWPNLADVPMEQRGFGL